MEHFVNIVQEKNIYSTLDSIIELPSSEGLGVGLFRERCEIKIQLDKEKCTNGRN